LSIARNGKNSTGHRRFAHSPSLRTLISHNSHVSTASGLLGREVRRAFEIDDWKAIGTALTRPSPPEIVKLDILDPKAIEEVLDEVK
jgi:hypothetical protein